MRRESYGWNHSLEVKEWFHPQIFYFLFFTVHEDVQFLNCRPKTGARFREEAG